MRLLRTKIPAHSLLNFLEFFDRIVVDAPCSGEGMFRNDEAARLEWSADHVTACAKRQQEIPFSCSYDAKARRNHGLFYLHVFTGRK